MIGKQTIEKIFWYAVDAVLFVVVSVLSYLLFLVLPVFLFYIYVMR